MLELRRFFHLLEEIRLADVLDILIVAGLLHFAISSFRRARSRFVVIGVGAMAVLYAFASLLDLTLTLIIFQAFVTVALVALVVIFQEEIRRAFERLAMGAPMRARSATRPDAVAMIVRAMTALAAKKTGALVVMCGKEPLERHISGGIRLDGELSEQLLDSIFDPSSAGHDGAVVIEAGRVRRFGVRLPSTEVDDVKRGLRHAAARGLSERSDALVIAVSEERGVISVSRGGQLREVSPSELERELADFVAEVAPEPARPRARSWLSSSLGDKVLALVLAGVAWGFVFHEQHEQVTRAVVVPVVLEGAGELWRIEPPDPREVRVTLTGSNRAFESLVPGETVVALDVAGVRPGAQVRTLRGDELRIPPGFIVEGIEPREIAINATELVDIEVAVQPRTSGKVDPGAVLIRVRVEPSKVRLRLPKTMLGQLGAVYTEPVVLDGLTRTRTMSVGLVLPSKAQLPEDEPPTVDVVVEVAERKGSPTPPPPPLDPAASDGDG